MKTPKEIQGYEIIIIQSLKEGDRKTGEELFNDILRYKPELNKDIYVKFYDISNHLQFVKTLKTIENDTPYNHTLTLHFETHGCIDGIGLGDGCLVKWRELFSLLRPINVKLSNLLMVIMSMCQGAAISSDIEPTLRCPFRAFVGFEKDMKEGDLLEAYSIFYETYNNMLDVFDALKRANSILPKDSQAWCLRARDIFDKVLNPDTNPDSFNTVIENNYEDYVKEKGYISKDKFRQMMCQYFIQTADDNRAFYNFEDII
jgi:hypothetical protein